MEEFCGCLVFLCFCSLSVLVACKEAVACAHPLTKENIKAKAELFSVPEHQSRYCREI